MNNKKKETASTLYAVSQSTKLKLESCNDKIQINYFIAKNLEGPNETPSTKWRPFAELVAFNQIFTATDQREFDEQTAIEYARLLATTLSKVQDAYIKKTENNIKI